MKKTDDILDQIYKLKEEFETLKVVSDSLSFFHEDITVRTLLESITEGVVVINEKGLIIRVNNRSCGLFGYTKDELVGQPISFLLPKRFHKNHHGHITHYFLAPTVRPMGSDYELWGVRKNGTEFPVEISLSYLSTEGGQLGMAFITDITQRKIAQDELKERNIELDAFAHTVAHDLKGILTSVVGFSDLIHKNPEMNSDERQKLIGIIAKNSKNMSNIINEMLLFASMRKKDVKLETVDMKEQMNKALDRLDYLISEKKPEFQFKDKICQVLGYGPWIEEVWYNYISNAIKYGGNPPKVEIGCQDVGNNMIQFWIKDNGAGLSPADQAILFDAPEKVQHKIIKGHGLGLSIVKRIINKLDGDVAVESNDGDGCTFSFTLKKVNV